MSTAAPFRAEMRSNQAAVAAPVTHPVAASAASAGVEVVPPIVKFPDCPTSLSAEQVAQYQRDGFLAFENFLTPIEVEALKSAMRSMIEEIVGGVRSGKGWQKKGDWLGMKNYSGTRLGRDGHKTDLLFEPDAVVDVATASMDEIESKVRKFSFPCEGHPLFQLLATHPRLMPLVEALLGPKPILYGDMALMKPGHGGVAKPWHQDSAYFDYLPFNAGVDVWIALDDATAENGCMQVLPGDYNSAPKKHHHTDDCEILPDRIDTSKAVTAELKAGGVLLFSVMMPHYTPPNRSAHSRRSAQLFFRGANTRLVKGEEHTEAYREPDGTLASCRAVPAKKAE
ncbi:MAG TPA: phytanoyl-CoA dioxygenase family protein [Planctomycetota bacterium]|nr:phytanoyl-CoA dioxygenase family protein [Planctomycetota bacterium]